MGTARPSHSRSVSPATGRRFADQQAITNEVSEHIAGVLFTHNSITGADEILIEASWGLGEAIVQGLVVPDRYRMGPTGELLEETRGFKELAVRPRPDGETRQEPVDRTLVEQLCLADAELRALHALAVLCDEVFGEEPHDIEFVFAAGALYLLQRRPVTAPPAPSDGWATHPHAQRRAHAPPHDRAGSHAAPAQLDGDRNRDPRHRA